MVRGPPSRTRCTGGNASHASPGAAAGASGAVFPAGVPASAPDDFRARHFSNIPTFSNLPSLYCRYA